MSDTASFIFYNPSDSENSITVVANGEEIIISVSDEKAVDSYNETFECSITLDKATANILLEYLTCLNQK